jgi:DNA invertase Pin-like site-specific DNA recombinase
MAEGKFISYLRVSTDKQGRSGLGIEAQREAVVRYLNGGQWTLSAEYVETESGRRSDRPKLAAALSHAKAIGAKLVLAKLDRLTRNVDLLRALVASGVDLVFCDLPSVPAGPMGRFLLTQMAAVAELEAGLIGERTKNALAAARKRIARTGQRGRPDIKRLGNPNGAHALKGKQVGNTEAVAKLKATAAQRAADLRAIVEDIQRSGITTVRGIAAELHTRGIKAPRGDIWHPTAVSRLLHRLSP